MTALDVKDAFLMVPQMEVFYVKIPMWIRAWTGNPHTHTLASEKVFARAAKCSIAVASAHWWLV